MGSEQQDKLPTIQFGKQELKEGSEEWNSARDQVYKAFEEYGAFEAIIDDETLLISKQRLFEKLKQAFSMPLKTLVPLNVKTGNGYYSSPEQPLVEAMYVRYGLTPGIAESISKTLWPNGDQEFSNLVHAYAKGVSELSEKTRKMIFDKLGLESLWDEHNKFIYTGFSMLKYRLPSADEIKVGLRAHKDSQVLTILSQHQIGVSGLQVKKKSGEWLDCEFSSPHSYIILNNECITALTNGRLHSPFHQVIIGDKERYSIAAFTGSKGIIKVPDKLVDEDHPLRYKPFDAVELTKYRQKSNLAGVEAVTIETFAGV